MQMAENKKGEGFGVGLVVIILSIALASIAFISEDNSEITGFAISDDLDDYTDYNSAQTSLIELEDFNSLRSLAAGNYYIDEESIVYWIDDESKPAIAKVNFINEDIKNRQIYIDDEGNIGYVIQ